MIDSQFVTAFIQGLDKEEIAYLIERNYEGLPYFTSNDIDFLLAGSDAKKFLACARNAASRLGFEAILLTKAYGGGRLYLGDVSGRGDILRMDYMTIIHYRGIPLLDADVILAKRRKRDLFFIPEEGMEAAISFVMPLMYGGYVKEKYKEAIHRSVLYDSDGFLRAFKPYLPSGELEDIVNAIRERKFTIPESRRSQLIASFLRTLAV